MNTKSVLILFALILVAASVFAAPTLTSNAPVTNEILYGGTQYTLDFNISNNDSNGVLATVPNDDCSNNHNACNSLDSILKRNSGVKKELD